MPEDPEDLAARLKRAVGSADPPPTDRIVARGDRVAGHRRVVRRSVAGGSALALVAGLAVALAVSRGSSRPIRVTGVAPPTLPTATLPTATPTTAPPTTVSGLHLVAGPYGFLVPVGWKLTPLESFGGPASFASFNDPASSATIDYELDGTGSVYKADHSADIAGLSAATTTQEWGTGTLGCAIASRTVVSVNELRYACVSSPSGMSVVGTIVVGPYPQGFRLLKITMPPGDQQEAGQIIASLNPPVACASVSNSDGTMSVCPGSGPVGTTIALRGTGCGGKFVAPMFLGPRSYIGSGGGGQSVAATVDASNHFQASFVIPATYTTGSQSGPVVTAPVTPGTGYSFTTYPAGLCSVLFTVMPTLGG